VDTGGRQVALRDFVEDAIVFNETQNDEEIHMATEDKKTSETPEHEDAKDSKTKENTHEEDNAQITEDGEKETPSSDGQDATDADDNHNTDDSTEDEEMPNFDSISEEELAELQSLDDQLEQIVDDLGEVIPEFKDAKLSTKSRKALSDSSFCGPNRSFPVNDCAHYTAALRLLNRAKVSSDTKAKIRSCVNSRGKKLGCTSDSTKDEAQSAVLELVQEQLVFLTEQAGISDKVIDAKTQRIVELEAEVDKLVEENSNLRASSHQDNAKEVLQLKIELKKPDVQAILDAESSEIEVLQKDMLAKFEKRSPESIKDSLEDLRLEKANHQEDEGPTEGVENPGLVSEEGDTSDDKVDNSITVIKQLGATDAQRFLCADKRQS